jgi:holo-[acyl-carrier protein] synthase
VGDVAGVGVDAIEIARVRAALERTPTLLGRLFTEREQAACRTSCGDLRWGGLATRFAAKEAVAKALGTGIRGFGFRDIEVVTDERGAPAVVLHAGAAEVAGRAGVARVLVSLSHAGELALASAAAQRP